METFFSLLIDYGLFLAKAVTIVGAIGVVAMWIAGSIQQARGHTGEWLEVTSINDRLEHLADSLRGQLLDKKERKARAKKKKAEGKQKHKDRKAGKAPPGKRLFVIDFYGDIRASAVTALREEISAVLQVAETDDEVLVRLESAGGLVHSYGLAASQLERLRARGLRLTATVDKLAASGGYLMACVADRIVAAPFAIIGSIGVVAQLPNFHRLLKDYQVDFELHTAGDYKRTLTMFGENTDAGRAKFREELEATHGLFKNFVTEHRSGVDIGQVATGEYWYGTRALELGLIDAVGTSDDLLLTAAGEDRQVFQVRWKVRERMIDRLSGKLESGLQSALRGWWLPR